MNLRGEIRIINEIGFIFIITLLPIIGVISGLIIG